ncbi:hypothetical protein HanPSC8_Chr17g0796851 [Helianthus annuus]|nr:hypothetical protein HanPSC8_Chr17g0796851 [Helianthus annuus]
MITTSSSSMLCFSFYQSPNIKLRLLSCIVFKIDFFYFANADTYPTLVSILVILYWLHRD